MQRADSRLNAHVVLPLRLTSVSRSCSVSAARRSASACITLSWTPGFSSSTCRKSHLREYEAAQWRRRRDRCRPLRGLEERDLADEVAALATREPLAALRHLGLAVHDHEELATDLPLAAEHRSRLDLEVVGDTCELGQLLLRQPLEERRPLEGLDLHVLAEQAHRGSLGALRRDLRVSLRDVADDLGELLRTRPHRPVARRQLDPGHVAQLGQAGDERVALLRWRPCTART